MVLRLEVPDEIARALSGAGQADPQRFALEALAVEGYRENRLTQKQQPMMPSNVRSAPFSGGLL